MPMHQIDQRTTQVLGVLLLGLDVADCSRSLGERLSVT